jgi:hypothetical protein
LSASRGKRIEAALAEEGFESTDTPLLYESQSLMIRRIGAAELAATIAELLPAIRAADREVSSVAGHRDDVVARLAIREWHRRSR